MGRTLQGTNEPASNMSSATPTKAKHQLSCGSCGETHLVDVSQAGQTIHCPCGAKIEIPTLRALRSLPLASKQTAPTAESMGWSRRHGAAFAVGLLAATLGMFAAAIFVPMRLNIDTRPPDFDAAAEAHAAIEAMTIDETWDAWRDARDQGLPPYMPPPHVEVRRYAWQLNFLIAIAVLMIVGGVGAAGAAVWRVKRVED